MHDTGQLAGFPVEDVVEEDGVVIHKVRGHVAEGANVRCSLDWERRFDFMQQHTAFHVLAQAFLRVTGAQTLSSHLGEEVSTLELALGEIDQETLAAAEELANRVLWANRPVRSYFVEADEAAQLPLRKRPAVNGRIRLIEIADFDLDPCSGTHVAATGEVGLVKIVGREKLRGHLRFRFVAGKRAVRDYGQKAATLEALAGELTTGEGEVLSSVRKLREELQNTTRQLRASQERLLIALRESLLSTQPDSILQVVEELEGLDWALVRKLAFQLLDGGIPTVILAQSAPAVHLAVGTRLSGADLRALVPELCTRLGAKGGGRPHFVEVAGGQREHLPATVAWLRSAVEHLAGKEARSSGS
jgi:alanyl-tRNA synthetase